MLMVGAGQGTLTPSACALLSLRPIFVLDEAKTQSTLAQTTKKALLFQARLFSWWHLADVFKTVSLQKRDDNHLLELAKIFNLSPNLVTEPAN